MKSFRSAFLVLFVLLCTQQAAAQMMVPDSTLDKVQTVTGVTFGTEFGYGFAMRYGKASVALELGLGFAPIFFYSSKHCTSNGVESGESKWLYYSSAMFGAKIDIALKKEKRIGLKLGCAYNSVKKFGAGGGLGLKVVNEPAIFIAAGIMYFPEAYDAFKEDLARCENEHWLGAGISSAFDRLILNTHIDLSLSIYFW